MRSVKSIISKNFSRSIVCMKKWSVETEPHTLAKASDIIHEDLIHEMMESTQEAAKDVNRIREILGNARDKALLKDHRINEDSEHHYVQGLTLEEAATLLNMDESNTEIMNELYDTALFIKQLIYGNRIVLFAPLYTANFCIGSCVYCGYRGSNKEMVRQKLSDEDLIEEVRALENLGHKRLMMLCGEHPEYSFDDFLHHLEVAASVKEGQGEIRRINVEIPQLSVSDFRRLKATGCVGTYVNFQETYHRETYEKMHPGKGGLKNDYDDRLLTMDRSLIAGLDDVGIGALYGLYDYRFEVLGLLEHSQHLDRTYDCGPHTISVPRINPASGSDVSKHPPYVVNDAQFKKIVATIRCMVPYTGMILTTRENEEMRNFLLSVGMSQMSAGSKTDIGSYKKGQEVHQEDIGGQFALGDHRHADVVIQDLMKSGYIPSWCTACYRKGRTGPVFMGIAKKGQIHNMCQPNALLTLQEYLLDYASEETKEIGFKLIEREVETITDERKKEQLIKALEKQNKGTRDLHF